jgi:hypothetical protein
MDLMVFAYADPPYVGQAKKRYSHDPLCSEVDHGALISKLCSEFEGWALSCSSPSLKYILSLPACPDNVRVGSWVKPFASFKPNVNPAYAWEPVIFWGGRPRGRELPTVRDWVSANITLEKGLCGAKPIRFCYWLFEILGAQPHDTFIDLYPGTGIVSKAWDDWRKGI